MIAGAIYVDESDVSIIIGYGVGLLGLVLVIIGFFTERPRKKEPVSA